ncbi:MAG: carboxypeptidase regulatory-like domain-containing protein [Planctomycetaceae bacterium]|nr:carboxypeptidase regulatory-like domain-containing protein [Planctomycetaceae bacterium]
MTIRYKCDDCGSKLNIKDELAGSQGKCPKCKSAFTVPQPDTSAKQPAVSKDVSSSTESQPDAPPQRKLSAKERITATTPARKSQDEEFDPVAFLMEDEPMAAPTRRVNPLSDEEIPMDLELELSDDDPPPARRARRRVELDSDAEMQLGSASASAGAMLSGGGSSANAAKDLLTRAVEESRARSSRIEEDEPAEPSELREALGEVLTRGLPGLLAIVITCAGIYFLIRSATSGYEYPELGYVTGTVTLDGKPLAGARVEFTPTEKTFPITEKRSIRVRSSKAFTNEEGYYELRYDQDVEGAVVGDHRVKINKPEGPREVVPIQFSGPVSTETRIVESGSQEFDFALESEN